MCNHTSPGLPHLVCMTKEFLHKLSENHFRQAQLPAGCRFFIFYLSIHLPDYTWPDEVYFIHFLLSFTNAIFLVCVAVMMSPATHCGISPVMLITATEWHHLSYLCHLFIQVDDYAWRLIEALSSFERTPLLEDVQHNVNVKTFEWGVINSY